MMSKRMVGAAMGLCLALPAEAQESAEVALVRQIFAQLQPLSIRDNVEYCGYIGFDNNDRLVASPATRGNVDSCLAADPVNLELIVASYHTHAAYSQNHDSEVPSGDDVEGDADEGIDGYVATPGGRLWYIDTVDMTISQLCGIGCLPADPRFRAGDLGPIAQSYSYDQLVRFLEN